MLDVVVSHAMAAAVLAACIFAWWKGGPAERAGALLIAGGWIVSGVAFPVAVAMHSPYAPYVPFLVDSLVAVGFLGLALRYSSAWLGVAVFLQAAELALHAAFLTGDGSGIKIYFVRVNFLGIAIILLFFGATVNVWLRRLAVERKAAVDGGAKPPSVSGLGPGQGGDGFPRKAFDTAPVAIPHRLVRR